MPARRALGALVLALSALAGSSIIPALAQPYPSKPVKLIVPFPPGGPPDTVGRLVAQHLSQSLGQPVIVENRSGAAGTVGMQAAAKAPPDGYTLGLGTTGTLAAAPDLYPGLGYDPIRSFAPLSLLTHTPFLVVIHPSIPATSLRELIALAKAKPGQIHFGSGGSGGPLHIAGEMFKTAAGVDLVHVPYKGIAAATLDLLTGRIQIIFEQPAQLLPHIRAGKLKALAVAHSKRFSLLPDLPTAAEAGLPGYEVSAWFGVLAPAGTPDAIVRRLNEEVSKILATNDVREALVNQGFEPAGSSPEQFAALISSEAARWSRAIKESGAKLD